MSKTVLSHVICKSFIWWIGNFPALSMRRALKSPQFFGRIALSNLCGILLILALLLGTTTGECAVTEQPSPPPEPVPVAPGPPPAPQERILSPIPRQFDWMHREVRPNPLLESILGLLSLREVPPRLLMSISLDEEYSDNFLLRERDREEEYRTRLTIGTVYRMESERSFVSLANSISGTYEARAEESSFAFAKLSLNAGHQLPRLSLALSESFIRSDEVDDATPTGVRRERRTFSSNSVSPQLRYQLTPTTAINGAYINTLVWNEDQGRDDADPIAGDQGRIGGNSVSHSFTTGLLHRFTRSLSGGVNYTFTTVDSEEAADTQSHAASADIAYSINPKTNASFRTFGTVNDRRNGATGVGTAEADSLIYGTSFGVRRQLTTFLAAFASLGPTVVDREGRPTRLFPNWQVSLDGALPITRRTSLSLSTQQRIENTAGDIDDVGLVQSQSAMLTLTHSISRDLLASVFADFTRTELLEDIATGVATQEKEVTFWSAGTRISYAFTPVWSLAMEYRHRRRDSDVPTGNLNGTGLAGKYDENRVTFSLSAAFPIF
jgi:hypothetical protein